MGWAKLPSVTGSLQHSALWPQEGKQRGEKAGRWDFWVGSLAHRPLLGAGELTAEDPLPPFSLKK